MVLEYFKFKVKVAQLCWTLWTCSPPGSSVHGIFQARILEWVALEWVPPSGDLPNSGIKSVSLASLALAGGFLRLAPLRKPIMLWIYD